MGMENTERKRKMRLPDGRKLVEWVVLGFGG